MGVQSVNFRQEDPLLIPLVRELCCARRARWFAEWSSQLGLAPATGQMTSMGYITRDVPHFPISLPLSIPVSVGLGLVLLLAVLRSFVSVGTCDLARESPCGLWLARPPAVVPTRLRVSS